MLQVKPTFIQLCFFICLFFTPINLVAQKKGAEPVKKVGDVGQIALPALAGSMTVVYWDKTGLIEFAKSFGTTMGVTYLLKPMINSDRPQTDRAKRAGRKPGNMSFPSGHTAAAFSGAAFLQMRYGWWWGVPCYLCAGYVGFSRIYGQRHWFMDVLGGAAIGVSANVLFTTRYSRKKWKLTPLLEENRVGFVLSWQL